MAISRLTVSKQVESIWKLGGLSKKQLARRVYREVMDNNLLGRAAELAYNFVLAMFPALLFLLSVFGLFAAHRTALRSSLLSYFSDFLPPAAFQVISHWLDEVSRSAGGGKITFGIVLSLWFAAGGMASMISTLDDAYHVREGRSFFRVRAIALGLTVVISALTVGALALVLISPGVIGFVVSLVGSQGIVVFIWSLLRWPVALTFLVVSFSLIYYFGPDVRERHWYWITPGSVVGVVLWLGASELFRVYLHFFNNYSKTYGSLGAAIILLVWLYVTGLAFLIGGEINAVVEHGAAEHGHPEAKAPGQKIAA
jgi:membrane protein